MKNRTTLQVERETLAEIKRLKKYPRETYQETLKEMIKVMKEHKKNA